MSLNRPEMYRFHNGGKKDTLPFADQEYHDRLEGLREIMEMHELDAVGALGSQRLLWGCDLTMETGLAKLRALENTGLSSEEDVRDIRWRNAARVFRLSSSAPEAPPSTSPTPKASPRTRK